MRFSSSAILAMVALVLAVLALLAVVPVTTALSLAVICLAVGLLIPGLPAFAGRGRRL